MTQTSNRLFDEMARLMTDAASVAQGVKREAETVFRTQMERSSPTSTWSSARTSTWCARWRRRRAPRTKGSRRGSPRSRRNSAIRRSATADDEAAATGKARQNLSARRAARSRLSEYAGERTARKPSVKKPNWHATNGGS